MIGLIFATLYSLAVVLIVPVCVVLNIRKRKKENNNGNNRQNTNNTYSHSGYVPGNAQRNVPGNAQRNVPGNAQRSTSGNTAEKKSQIEQSGSTREYLEKKAMEDQREHAAEKMEEQRRVSAKYGNMPIGKRHILGDPVPTGMRIVCCKYCGAENEVKTGYGRGLACYFCRTEL